MENERNEYTVAQHLQHVEDFLKDPTLYDFEPLPIIQSVFMESQASDDLFLMEMHPDLIKEISEGQIFTVRGEPNESAVLCSGSSTYDIKETETSNALLVSSDLLFPENFSESDKTMEKTIKHKGVTEIFHNYYELRPCAPKLKKLTDLLQNSLYHGKEYEDESIKKYTFDELLTLIQASVMEIESALRQIHACEINGCIRLLDFEYKFEVFCRIMDVLDSESIPIHKIPKESIIRLLEDVVPRQILEQMFVWYTSKAIFPDENEHDFCALKENEVCQIYGEVILRPMTMFRLQDFLDAWQKTVPDGMTTALSQLKGLVVCKLDENPQIISYFPAIDLPYDINERLEKLFKKKSEWSYEEIEPYIKDVTFEKNDAKTLLVKHSRFYYLDDGTLMFASRH